jgi:hypothetical protein
MMKNITASTIFDRFDQLFVCAWMKKMMPKAMNNKGPIVNTRSRTMGNVHLPLRRLPSPSRCRAILREDFRKDEQDDLFGG